MTIIIEIRGRIVKSMLSNCSEMLILGTYWTTWYSVVCEQTCTIDHKMDQSMWSTIISFDLLHSSYMWIQTVLSRGNTAKQCRQGLFQDSDFARDLEDSKSASGGTLCIFGSRTFVPISWMCKKQTSVSHSSTESEIISLDAGLRLDGLPALDLWDLIVAVFHGNTNQRNQARWDLCSNQREVRAVPHTIQKRKQSQGVINDLDNIGFILSKDISFHQEALLYIFEDNEAMIKMIIERRSPTMRHDSRTQRVAFDGLFDRINGDARIQIKYIDTKNQLADMLTKGNFTRDEWNHLLCLFNISHFSSTNCSEVMSKKTQEDAGEERGTAKIEADDEFGLAMQRKDSWRACPHCIRSPGKTRCESQIPLSSWTEQHLRTGNLFWTLTHQVTQSGMLTRIGLLKSGNLMKWWK